MTFAVAWIALPLVLGVLSLGCGLLLETVSGMRLPGTLLLPGGFVVVALATYFAHMTDTTAPLQTPLVIALALAGYGVSRPWKRFQFDGWLTGSALGVYAVFAAPVALAGVTFAGYIKLDDTATFMSFLDRATNHGYGAGGLPVSTYKAVLQHEGYKYGYPLGSMLPLDVGHTILGVDQLWLWQPYLTFLAVLTALGLYELASGLVTSRWLRFCVAFFGAQAALSYGYGLWGGVKELFAPGVVLFAICLVPRVKVGTPRQVIPLAAASAAVIAGLSVGGGIWLLPLIGTGLALLLLYRPVEDALKTMGVYTVTVGVLSIPILAVSSARLNSLGKFMKQTQNGNLGHPLSWWQLLGIWPTQDFRGSPSNLIVAHVLGLLVLLGAIYAVVTAWRRGRVEVVLALGTAVFACLVYVERASPWVGGKAFASACPLVLGVGVIGAAIAVEAALAWKGRHAVAVGAALVLALIGGGVLWSNWDQYLGVLLAPGARLTELETIGSKFSGQGPALLTEFEPYAARHLLRGLDAETASGLRVHLIQLRHPLPCSPTDTSGGACNGVSPDVDEIKLGQLLYFRTLIIRRTGLASRPPSVYDKVWSGRYYDVWEKNPSRPSIIQHLSLGSRLQPAAVPKCSDVMALAHLAAAAHGRLAAVYRQPAILINPATKLHGAPTQFGRYGEPSGLIYSNRPYVVDYPFKIQTAGTYTVWIGGSFNSTLIAKVDGKEVGQSMNQTEWPGNFLKFGKIFLTRGFHTLRLKHRGAGLWPGTAAFEPFGTGPFALAQGTDASTVSYVQPKDARSLCGKSLDWVEALRR